MKRFFSALALCSTLLVLLSLVLFPPVAAKEDAISKLLALPAPPPPNPLVKRAGWARANAPYTDKGEKPPPDDAPIEELIEYWTAKGVSYRGALYYTPKPSDRVLDRLLTEAAKDKTLINRLLNILPADKRVANYVKDAYDSLGEDGSGRDQRQALKNWLKYNSPHFAQELEKVSLKTKDSDGYVNINSENHLLALTVQDFDRANPIITRMYGDRSQPVTQVLATWALYKRALETNSTSDIDRYRRELMDMVENKSLSDGVRDKANDAITHEVDFPGRDEWSFSLFEDETLVNMPRFTMLTTLIMYSPPEKYVPKMIELLNKSSKPIVRTAAARNLTVVLNRQLPPELEKEVVRALLPALEDPKWLSDREDIRSSLVQKLNEHEIPESVPGLIKVLNEKQTEPRYRANTVANTAANAASAAANAVANSVYYSSNVNRAVNAVPAEPVDSYPFRWGAIRALTFQKDSRAVQPLRRVLPEVEYYERNNVVRGLLACNGFTIAEQLDALDEAARGVRYVIESGAIASNAVLTAGNYAARVANAPAGYAEHKPPPITAAEIRTMLGQQLMRSEFITDALARSVVDRIESLDKRDPQMAAAYRRIVLNWENGVINSLLLRDVKRGVADADTILRLLAQRKLLREKHSPDVFDLRGGTPSAVGIAACLLEDTGDYETILNTGNSDAKSALFACARLIRAPLPVEKVATNLTAKEPLLARAAEAYLVSEDSPRARAVVLSLHGGEAMILGAKTSFVGEKEFVGNFVFMAALFASSGNEYLSNNWHGPRGEDQTEQVEKSLQDEVKKDTTLLGVYAYDRNYVRIYNDRVIFSWDEDDSRYWERPLSKVEFDELKSYLVTQRADELPPFLYCTGGYCPSKELVMLGRNGGRRVFLSGDSGIDLSSLEKNFFVGLDKYFLDLKREPAKLKYVLSREIPGLEIVLARDDLRVATVWGEGGEIRVAASETAAREKVRKELAVLREDQEELAEEDYEEPNEPPDEPKKVNEYEKRRYEGYSWYRVANNEVAGVVAQPPGVEFIPLRDGLSVPVGEEQWKARAAGFEIRAGDDGLYKVVAGRLTKLLSGNYSSPVVSPDGRWALVTKTDEEEGNSLVRVNLATRKETPVEVEEYGNYWPTVHIPSLGRFLVENSEYGHYENESYYGGPDEDDSHPNEVSEYLLKLTDVTATKLQPIIGEMRPIAQQSFRPLQKATRPGDLWAALPDSEKNETVVGTLNTRSFAFKQVIRVPKIQFDSMQMWVDEPRKKLYFVYRGHLLSLPLPI